MPNRSNFQQHHPLQENAEDTIKEQRDRRQPRQVKKPSAGSADTDAMFSALAKAQQKRTERLRKLDAAHAAAPLKPRYDHIGNEIDGGFTKDPVVFRWGCIVLFWLSASCILQWIMFALPNWRGDQYQTAGLFQVCSTVDLQFNPMFADASGAGNLTIKAPHEYTCQSVESYVNKFLDMVKPDPNHPRPSDRWYSGAAGALPHILASRYLEAAGTALDMVFGIGSVLLIMRPNKDARIETRNVAIAFIGLVLMPAFPTADILISFDFWDRIGVGYFESLSYNSSGFSNYTKAGAVVSLFTSWFDFVIELVFLQWGLRRLYTRANVDPEPAPSPLLVGTATTSEESAAGIELVDVGKAR